MDDSLSETSDFEDEVDLVENLLPVAQCIEDGHKRRRGGNKVYEDIAAFETEDEAMNYMRTNNVGETSLYTRISNSRYRCQVHINCDSIRMCEFRDIGVYVVKETGDHKLELREYKYGMNKGLASDIERLIKEGVNNLNMFYSLYQYYQKNSKAGDNLARKHLLEKMYQSSPKSFLIKLTSLRNRMRRREKVEDPNCLKTLNDLLREHKVRSLDEVRNGNNKLIVLSSLIGLNDGMMTFGSMTQGFAFSSQLLLDNVILAMNEFQENMVLMVDGTYKLLFNGWVMLVISTYTINVFKSGYPHTYRPIMFSLVPSESTTYVKETANILRNYAKQIHDMELNVKFVVNDCSDAIASGITEVFDGCKVLNCWFHLVANIKKQEKKRFQSINKEHILSDLNVLHLSPSSNAFDLSCKLFLRHWNAIDAPFCQYFKDQYLCDRWKSFYISAPGKVYGVPVTNNASESLNALIKKSTTKPSSMMQAIKITFPRLIQALQMNDLHGISIQRETLTRTQLEVLCSAPFSPDLTKKLMERIVNVKHQYIKVSESSYVITSTANSHTNIDENLARLYLAYKSDEYSDNWEEINWEEYKRIISGFHEVNIQETEMNTFVYTCDCKSFYHSACICSHSILIRHIHQGRRWNLEKLLEKFTQPKKKGRKRKTFTPALSK